MSTTPTRASNTSTWLSAQNLASIEIGKDFMVSHGYIKNDFNVHEWAAPQFAEQAVQQLLEERWEKLGGERLGLEHPRLG